MATMTDVHRTGIISHTKRQPFRHAYPSRSYGFSMAQIVRQEHTERFREDVSAKTFPRTGGRDMNQELQQLFPSVLGFFGAYTLPTLLILVLVEEAGMPIPIPGDSLLVLAGALALDRPPWFTLVALAGTYLAVLIGSSFLYLFMRLGGRRFVTHFGKYLRLGPSRLARVERWFERHHQHALVIGRLIPGMRIPTTALAGLTGLPYRRYLSGVAVAAGIWITLCFGLGVIMRLEGPQLLGLIGPLARQLVRTVPAPLLIPLVALVVLDALVVVILVRHLRDRRPREVVPATERDEGSRDRTRVA